VRQPEKDAAQGRGDRRPPGGVALVLLAAGNGSRVGREINKVFLPLAGRRVLTWSLDSTARLPNLVSTVVVLQDHDRVHVHEVLRRESINRTVELVEGGASRHESELHALRALAPQIHAGLVDVVVIHDAARPLAGPTLFREVVDTAALLGGALPVLSKQGIVFSDGTRVEGRLMTVQTPQAFHARPLLQAYEQAAREGFLGSDTASCVERFTDLRVHGVAGDASNIKITFPEDLFLAERLLERSGWRLS
jgi:2-C-methyl-D-erythritol 4-phosphate cytidylyltransferase